MNLVIASSAGAYAGIIGEGYKNDRMEVTILETDGTDAGTYHAQSDWAGAYYSAGLTDEEYFQLVLDTLEASG